MTPLNVQRGLNRREFLKTVAGGAALVTLGPQLLGATQSLAAPRRRPNILVIMSDEHNASVMGCTGNSLIRTPSLDSLAGRGMVFENCYCNSPLCVPSRLSFTSGKYASGVAAWSNACRLPSDDYPSLPHRLNAAGYQSYLCGKMHYDAAHRYGFTEIGQDSINRGHMTGRGIRRRPDDLATHPGYSGRFDEFHAADNSAHLTHDRKVTAGVLDFLKGRKASDKPFFLLAGYICPHFPLIVPQKYWDAYKGNVAMPDIPAGFLDSLPLNYKHLRVGFHVENVPDEIVRKGRELYYGLTQWVDEQIGQVLSGLTAGETAEDTVVIYTADHGENMGEHGMWWKNCMYNQAARVPLIVAWPGRWKGGQRRTGACSLLDVVQTIAALGGAKAGEDWNGESMLAWLDEPSARWKDRAVSEYYAHNIASGFAMLRAGQHKYVYHAAPDATHPAQRELYDLKEDPGEFHNLAAGPEGKALVADLHAALVKEIGEEPDKTEARCRADYAKGYEGAGPKARQRQTAPVGADTE